MNYQQTVNYLYNSTPVFEHVGASAYKEGLHDSGDPSTARLSRRPVYKPTFSRFSRAHTRQWRDDQPAARD